MSTISISYKTPKGQMTTISVDTYLYEKAKSKLCESVNIDWAIKELLYCVESRNPNISRSKVVKEFLIDLLNKWA